MEKEYQILSHLQDDENTSQRKLALRTGLSLGTVNLLLKRMIRKGLVKTRRLNARSLQYILTPQGLTEKSKLTYHFIRNSYAQITRLTSTVKVIVTNIMGGNDRVIYLYGPQNEVLEVLKLVLNKEQVNHIYISEDRPLPEPSPHTIVIVWDLDDEAKLSQTHRTINILKELKS